MEGLLVLLLIMIAGLVGGNATISLAAALMVIVRLAGPPSMMVALDRFSVDLGILFLVMGLLMPFATGQMGVSSSVGGMFSRTGLVTTLVGAAAAFLAREGVALLRSRPEAMLGLVLGSLIGVSFLGGIPAGPLVAAGLAAVLLQVLR